MAAVFIVMKKAALFSRRRLGIHAPSTDLHLARLGARLARLGVQPPHLARRPPYRLENCDWLCRIKLLMWIIYMLFSGRLRILGELYCLEG